MNYKIIGGSYSHYSKGIANGSNYYLELTDSEGNKTGKWLGGYVDNLLLSAAISFNTSTVNSAWIDATATEPNSKKSTTDR